MMSTIAILLFFALITILAFSYWLYKELQVTRLVADAQARYITNQHNRIDELEQRCERLRQCLVTELTPKAKTRPNSCKLYLGQELNAVYFIETHLN